MRNKQELIHQVINLLNAIIEVEEIPSTPPTSNEQVEILTIKECAQQFSGLSDHPSLISEQLNTARYCLYSDESIPSSLLPR